MGETREEISQALTDLLEAGCDLITITQYLRPTNKHQPLVDGLKFILEEKLKKQISTKGWEKDIQLLIERDLKEMQSKELSGQ